MTKAEYKTQVFGSHVGDQGSLADKVVAALYDTMKYGGALSIAAVPDDIQPNGVYILSDAGTLNPGTLTVAIGDVVMYDPSAEEFIFLNDLSA